jgi:hypothetical protein
VLRIRNLSTQLADQDELAVGHGQAWHGDPAQPSRRRGAVFRFRGTGQEQRAVQVRLIVVGTDQRFADTEPLKAMLEAKKNSRPLQTAHLMPVPLVPI